MIPVKLQDEPKNFEKKVRQPGKKWLAKRSVENTEVKNYWSKVKEEIYESYSGICAYYAEKIHRSTSFHQIDHFLPKSKFPDLAYEWSNYRLSSETANRRKWDFEDVLDPFTIEHDTFRLWLHSGEVTLNPNLDSTLRLQAETTMQRLQLNHEDLKRSRCDAFNKFSSGRIDAIELLERAPFVHYEAVRQGLCLPDENAAQPPPTAPPSA